jgi:hypothetical protein
VHQELWRLAEREASQGYLARLSLGHASLDGEGFLRQAAATLQRRSLLRVSWRPWHCLRAPRRGRTGQAAR